MTVERGFSGYALQWLSTCKKGNLGNIEARQLGRARIPPGVLKGMHRHVGMALTRTSRSLVIIMPDDTRAFEEAEDTKKKPQHYVTKTNRLQFRDRKKPRKCLKTGHRC